MSREFDPISFAMGKAAGRGGGDITVESLSVTENGEFTAPSGKAYSPVTVDVQAGDLPEAEAKDVNFIDYDGKILYSYTAAEFAQLSSLPANPSHDGLTAQGWNWSLSDAKSYVAAYGMLWIGQQYVTSDGKTRIYIHLEPGRLAPYLGIGTNGKYTIDWGDGSSTQQVTGSSSGQSKFTQHTYAEPGDYVITVTSNSGNVQFNGSDSGGHILQSSNSTSEAEAGHIYRSAIRKIEVGSYTMVGTNAFRCCYNLTTAVIPPGNGDATFIGEKAFHSCYGLRALVIPTGITQMKSFALNYCYGLRRLSIAKGMTKYSQDCINNCRTLESACLTAAASGSEGWGNLANNYGMRAAVIPEGWLYANGLLQKCYALSSVTIPSTIGTLDGDFFKDCYGLGEIHFKAATPPTISSSGAFSNVPTSCKIYVPAGKLSAYTGATNYPSSSSYTYVEE